MGRLGFSSDPEKGSGERRPHRPYRYLVDWWGTVMWVHCPVCLSRNAGWWGDGSPRYSGGAVEVEEPYDLVPGTMTTFTYACLCADGQGRLSRRRRSIADVSPVGGFPSLAASIIWVRDQSQGKPPEPTKEEEERDRIASEALAKEIRKYDAGKQSLEALTERCKILYSRFQQKQGRLQPSIRDVLTDRALRSLYFQPELPAPDEVTTQRAAPQDDRPDLLPYRDD